MSRFSTYLQSQKLAKMHLQEAEIHWRQSEDRKAMMSLMASVREFQTATNCIASLAFEPRKKRRAVKP